MIKPIPLAFGLGMDNRSPETALPPGYVRAAVNVDIAPGQVVDQVPMGAARTREGFTLVDAATWHSVWAHPAVAFALGVRNGVLTRIANDGNLTRTTLQTLTDAAAPVSYAEAAGTVWWSNGTDRGRVSAAGAALVWGVPEVTATLTLAAAGSGGLHAGRYQVCASYLDAAGEESAPSAIKTITLTEGQGITLTLSAAAPTGATKTRIYRSSHDGDVLYHAGDVVGSTTSIAITNTALRKPIETLGARRTPAASIVRAWNGRLWCAAGSVVWFSMPGRYGLYRPMDGFFLLPGTVTLLEPVEDGLYVGHARGVEFWAGADPQTFQRVAADACGAVAGTGLQIPVTAFQVGPPRDRTATVAAWWSTDGGLVVGRTGGLLQRVTRERLATLPGASGAMLYRRGGEFERVLSVYADGGDSPLQANDTVIEAIIENGIELP